MTGCTRAVCLAVAVLAATPALSQSNQLRGVQQSGSPRLPSAQQQLNGNLNRQQTDFNFQQRLDSSNRLNRVDQINRNNNRQNIRQDPCASSNEACQNKD